MENASKALLIAGAILIAILLIAIGMMVFNSANGVIDTAASGMTDHQKTMHNKKFNIYEGRISGSSVLELVEVVRVNNQNDENVDVTIKFGDIDLLTDKDENIKRSRLYNVSCTQDTNGLITEISVEITK